MTSPGHQTGHLARKRNRAAAANQRSLSGLGSGLDWAGYLALLVSQRGTLAAIAEQLAVQRSYQDDVNSIERALRRLRKRGQRDGGRWGRRLIEAFGMPVNVETRVRWMGQYHSRFTDLPSSIARDLLLPWDRPPVSESPARIWIQLGLGSLSLRARQQRQAKRHIEQARLAAAHASPTARAELALVSAYLYARDDEAANLYWLDEAERWIQHAEVSPDDGCCLWARLVDQRAYQLNKSDKGAANHHAALTLYEQLSDDAPPFARCRKHNGMGWSLLKLGNLDAALEHARLSLSIAGDAGSLRMRAMALNLLTAAASASGETNLASEARARSLGIASRLEDAELQLRYRQR